MRGKAVLKGVETLVFLLILFALSLAPLSLRGQEESESLDDLSNLLDEIGGDLSSLKEELGVDTQKLEAKKEASREETDEEVPELEEWQEILQTAQGEVQGRPGLSEEGRTERRPTERAGIGPTMDSESEPNNTFGTANAVEAGGEVSGSIQPRGDADWLRFSVEHQGELKVTSTEVPEEIELVFRAWNANKDSFTEWFAPLRAGGETEGVIDLPSEGDYYIEVRDNRDDTASPDSYGLEFAFTPTVDEREPNNIFGKAAAIDIGEAVQATILPKGDADWYSIEVEDQGELKVLITEVAEEMAYVFRVWNANRDPIPGWLAPLRAGGETEGVIDLPEAGRYCIEVREDRDDGRSVEPYSMTLTYTETGDTLEPNDSFGAAALLDLDESIQATILPKGDADWYCIEVGREGELQVNITQSPSDLDMTFRVWNAEKAPISQWIAPLSKGGDTEGKIGLPSGGTYFIEVRDGRDDGRSVEAYTLSATLR